MDNNALLDALYKNHNKSASHLLDSVFDFLFQEDLTAFTGSNNISGEHVIYQSYNKARLKYMERECSSRKPSTTSMPESIVPEPSNEVEVVAVDSCERSIPRASESQYMPPRPKEKKTTSNNNKFASFDTSNGAKFDNYAWTQTNADIELRILVPSHIQKGRQIKSCIENNRIKFDITHGELQETLLSGEFSHPIKSEESGWSLDPGQYILISLEKSEDILWDRLLKDEPPINLKNVSSNRDFHTLPEDLQSQVREMMWNREQTMLGKPTSDKIKMEEMLKKAWNAEGSPFQGQPYDPSCVNFASSNMPS